MMTQCERIERHLRDHGSITTQDAYTEYGCTRLAARIFDIERKGDIRISKKKETGKNRYGESVTYTRYCLEGRE